MNPRLIFAAAWLAAATLGAVSAGAQPALTPLVRAPAFAVQVSPLQVTDSDLEAIRAFGFEYVRFGYRSDIAAAAGRIFDQDAFIERVRKAGLKPLVTIFGGRELVADAEDRAKATARFMASVIRKHLDAVAVWEFWNEPENPTFLHPERWDDFARAVTLTCAELQRLGLHPMLVGYGFATIPAGAKGEVLLRSWKQAHAAGCISGLSYHPYNVAPTAAPARLDALRRTLSPGAPLDFYLSEWGVPVHGDARRAEDDVAALTQMLFAAATAGAKIFNVYSWRDSGPSPSDKEQNFGLHEFDGARKATFNAVRDAVTLLKGARVSRLVKGAGVDSMRVEAGGRTTLVAWSSSGQTLRLPRVPGQNCRYRRVGDSGASACSSQQDEWAMPMGRVPVLVELTP